MPAGILVRNTSVPFRYTTAPSSRRTRSVRPPYADGSLTLKARRKYVVVYFALLFGPYPTSVASSLSPYPSSAAPLFQPVSSKDLARQAVPWSAPVSRYFQTAPVGTSTDCCARGGDDEIAQTTSAAAAMRSSDAGRREI